MRPSAAQVLPLLEQAIPDTRTELAYRTPYELLMATILSAQCTDERVNQVTPALFDRYPDPASLAAAEVEAVEELVRSTGFFRDKTKRLLSCSQALLEMFQGKVPQSMEELLRLPGVGRKTANLLLGELFAQPAVVVDTHVRRVSQRLGLTRAEDPEEIEADLQAWMPPESWWTGSSRLLLHGRRVCQAKTPRCGECCLRYLCPIPALTARG